MVFLSGTQAWPNESGHADGEGLLNLRHSIIRRSAAVTTVFVAGHALNYALMLAANHLLDAGGFGLFYTALLIINVLLSPMIAVMLVLVRRLADVSARMGRPQVVAMTWQVLRGCMRALPVVGVVAALLAYAAHWLGFEAWPIALLIPLTVLALLATEILRAAFQSMLLFGWQNAVWLASTGTQFLFSAGALWLVPRVWTGIGGVLLGAVVTFAAFVPWFIRDKRLAPPEPQPEMSFDLGKELPVIFSYVLFIVLNNVDILVGYWVLPRAALDVYAASSLLPKAITTATFAVAQVVLPVLVEQKADGLSGRRSVVKAVGMVLVVGALGAVCLWIVVPYLQKTPLAIHGLNFPIMIVLAIAAVALGAIRVLVVVEIALRRSSVGLAQIGAILLFVLICVFSGASGPRIAELYAAISCGFLLTGAVAMVTSRPRLSGLYQTLAR
jgi:O-antigen/teichoic acid export membrane protein